MRKIVAVLVLMVSMPALAAVSNSGIVSQKPLGVQNLTPTVSTSLTLPTGAVHAMISVRTAGVMMLDTGATPTAAVGFYLPPGTVMKVDNDPKWLTAMKFICSNDTGTCSISVLYYRNRRPNE